MTVTAMRCDDHDCDVMTATATRGNDCKHDTTTVTTTQGDNHNAMVLKQIYTTTYLSVLDRSAVVAGCQENDILKETMY